MRLRVRAALAVAAVALLATAGIAWADTGVLVTLFGGPSAGYYGQDIVLMPQVNTETKVAPGSGLKPDKFEFQIDNKGTWEKYDDQLVEETGTVDPLMLVFDDSVKYPADFRVLYYRSSKDASGVVDYALQATSDPITIERLRHAVSKVVIAAPKKVGKGKSFTTSYAVKPLSGVGKVKVTVARKSAGRFVKVSSKTLTTDEMSSADLRLKYKKAGTYRITATFTGNSWAKASSSATRIVTVK
jgi:hypothetical protein